MFPLCLRWEIYQIVPKNINAVTDPVCVCIGDRLKDRRRPKGLSCVHRLVHKVFVGVSVCLVMRLGWISFFFAGKVYSGYWDPCFVPYSNQRPGKIKRGERRYLFKRGKTVGA